MTAWLWGFREPRSFDADDAAILRFFAALVNDDEDQARAFLARYFNLRKATDLDDYPTN